MNKVKQLKANPLFHFSLGSKELFHSNFWFWLSTINPVETAKLFISDVSENQEEVKFERERVSDIDGYKVDLYIENGGQVVLVENKIKDYPNIEQLERAAKCSRARENIKLVLVTLIPYNQAPDGFTEITYRDLSRKIVATKFSTCLTIQSYINDYIEMISLLSDIILTQETSTCYNFAINYNKNSDISNIHFGELYQKYRASHLCQWYRDREIGCGEITSKASFGELDYYSDYNLFHNAAAINFFVKIMLGGKYFWAGVQIQNTQFRVMVHGELREVRGLDDYCEKLWSACKQIGNYGRGDAGYCRFGTSCRYRHSTIEKDIAYEDLKRQIKIVLDKAKKLAANTTNG